MKQKITLSVCAFQNGGFDVIIQDPTTGEEVTLSGEQKLDDQQFAMIDRLAPACVFTTYEREEL